jgi:hypothetical protein
MFSGSVQPPIVSLFSSTGSDPLYLWSVKTDSSLPVDSFTCLLDDAKSIPTPPPPAVLIHPHPVVADASGDGADDLPERVGYSLTQTGPLTYGSGGRFGLEASLDPHPSTEHG